MIYNTHLEYGISHDTIFSDATSSILTLFSVLPTGAYDFPSDEHSTTPKNPLTPGIKLQNPARSLFLLKQNYKNKTWKSLVYFKHMFDSFMSRLVLGVHSVSYKVVTRDFLGVKTTERRATTLPLLRTVVTNMWTLASTSSVGLHGR